ncbi:hypothetical protein GCM10020295_12970 [Streptomyces cinereospinus]
MSLCGVNAPWAAVRLALGDDPGQIVPPFLGQDYTVVSGPRPLRPVSVSARRTEQEAAAPVRPAVPAHAQAASAAEVLPL